MKNLHIPKNFQEVVHSPVTLVSGTALLATAVILAYNFIKNANGEVLIDVAAGNLISMVQMMMA
ncbi:hypothetical protein GW756_04755 [bacterium]|nr:hypothetical protein [bacterium]NCQ55690.1 hypothetical protein [Candidatus Parcubacteria bacterium]NCS67639.1 hypothetical protein [Candidatus Peregrinibacteria bacterium]NCS96653.1 hypothetical protein [bacterium]